MPMSTGQGSGGARVAALDLQFLGLPGAIAAGLLEGPGGLALVDPGPASCLDGLRASLALHGHALEEVDAVLVTHIHLDHSGGVGMLVRSNPRIQVYVHRRGAPHVVDPSKLISSASRLYGDRMGPLWGEILPVPVESVHPLDGGEVLRVAGVEVRVAYTPGHAVHHVSYFETSSGTVFAGDAGGIRVGQPLLVLPPTPPPDIDVEAWDASLALIRAWDPRRIFVTHFGGFDQPLEHLADLEARLHDIAGIVRGLLLDQTLDDAARQRRFADRMMSIFRECLPDEKWVQRYAVAIPVEHCWQGLARYWQKRL
jgi:glyoxylase-like metal-dependent hydrolase (beta-lactamase superfamily II)